ncbi:ATP-binding protein, partial [Dactylosporangium sp. NPDC049742]|uniref:ATP-binding protein n=1 Tax=Dactylosporangium sp. NPDC049742 TaxID=3154737 RepID=UPI00344AEC93
MTATTLATTAVHWPLVGRSTEVQHLSALLCTTDEAGVLLIGEAGVGKSRLAQEVAQRCTDGGMLVSTLSGWEAADGLPLAAAAPLLDRMDELVDDHVTYEEHDRAFHDIVMHASGN